MTSCNWNGWAAVFVALSLLTSSGAQMISVDRTGAKAGGNGVDETYLISGDGRYAAFSSSGTNYVAHDTNGLSDVFVYDCVGNSNVWNTCYSAGALGGFFGSRVVDLTPDGRFLLFLSRATNHVAGLTFSGGESYQLYVRDLLSNVTHLASAALDGTNAAVLVAKLLKATKRPSLLKSLRCFWQALQTFKPRAARSSSKCCNVRRPRAL